MPSKATKEKAKLAKRKPPGSRGGVAKKPPRGRPFKPGQSGNPSGRAAIPAEVREAARAHTQDAINTLVELLAANSESVRVMAANSLLDRAWGKPAQAVNLGDAEGGPLGVKMRVLFGDDD